MTEEQCCSTQLNILTDCFNDCDIYGKTVIISVKILSYALMVFIIIGIALPKQMVTYHLILCLLLLFCFTINYLPLNDLLLSTLTVQTKQTKYKNIQLINASKQTPFSTDTCKVLLLALMSITIFNFIYPEYSLHAMCTKTYLYINEVDSNAENITIEHKIATEFKIKSTQSKLNDNINTNINANTNANANANAHYPDINLNTFSHVKTDVAINSLDQVNDVTDINIFNKTYQPLNLQITRIVNGAKNMKDHVTKNNDIIIKF